MAKEKKQTFLLPWAFPQPFCMIWAKSLPSLRAAVSILPLCFTHYSSGEEISRIHPEAWERLRRCWGVSGSCAGCDALWGGMGTAELEAGAVGLGARGGGRGDLPSTEVY